MDFELWLAIYLGVAGASIILYPKKYVPNISFGTAVLAGITWPYIWIYVVLRAADTYFANRNSKIK